MRPFHSYLGCPHCALRCCITPVSMPGHWGSTPCCCQSWTNGRYPDLAIAVTPIDQTQATRQYEVRARVSVFVEWYLRAIRPLADLGPPRQGQARGEWDRKYIYIYTYIILSRVPSTPAVIGAPWGCCGHASGIYSTRSLWFGGCATRTTPCSVPGYSYFRTCLEKSERNCLPGIHRQTTLIREATSFVWHAHGGKHPEPGMRQAGKVRNSRRLRPKAQYSQVIKRRPWPGEVAAYRNSQWL